MGWLITLGILVILAWLPLGATVRYNDQGVALKVIAGPVRIPILPKKEAPEKEKPKKEEKPKKKQPVAKKTEAPKPQEEKGGPVTDFLPLVQTALDLLNAFRKKLRINHLYLKLIMASDDPCDLAVNYGKANAAMGNLLPLLERCFVIKKRDIKIECDFESDKTVIIARADLTITLGRLLGILIFYGVKALKQFLSIQNKRKGGNKHE
jgi:hypothetical protein